MRWGLLAVILAVLAGAPQASAAGCAGLSGHFAPVRGSAGAGNIVYTLSVHNGGTASCTLQGLPVLQLYGLTGMTVPTHVVRDPRFTPKPFVLRPGKTATAMTRFSPDVPGPGEPKGASRRPSLTALRLERVDDRGEKRRLPLDLAVRSLGGDLVELQLGRFETAVVAGERGEAGRGVDGT